MTPARLLAAAHLPLLGRLWHASGAELCPETLAADSAAYHAESVPDDFLTGLEGEWRGTGFSSLWVPMARPAPSDATTVGGSCQLDHSALLWNNYTEELWIRTPRPGTDIRNRGYANASQRNATENADQIVRAAMYEQTVADADDDDQTVLHFETGTWMQVEPPLPTRWRLHRLAAIPHGTVLLASASAGQRARASRGRNITEEYLGILTELDSSMRMTDIHVPGSPPAHCAPPNGYTEACVGFRGKCPLSKCTAPTRVLRENVESILAARGTISQFIRVNLTAAGKSGGTLDTEFVSTRARTQPGSFQQEVHLLMVKNQSTHAEYTVLHTAQAVKLAFQRMAPGCPLLQWPHVTASVLRRSAASASSVAGVPWWVLISAGLGSFLAGLKG